MSHNISSTVTSFCFLLLFFSPFCLSSSCVFLLNPTFFFFFSFGFVEVAAQRSWKAEIQQPQQRRGTIAESRLVRTSVPNRRSWRRRSTFWRNTTRLLPRVSHSLHIHLPTTPEHTLIHFSPLHLQCIQMRPEPAPCAARGCARVPGCGALA